MLRSDYQCDSGDKDSRQRMHDGGRATRECLSSPAAHSHCTRLGEYETLVF